MFFHKFENSSINSELTFRLLKSKVDLNFSNNYKFLIKKNFLIAFYNNYQILYSSAESNYIHSFFFLKVNLFCN